MTFIPPAAGSGRAVPIARIERTSAARNLPNRAALATALATSSGPWAGIRSSTISMISLGSIVDPAAAP